MAIKNNNNPNQFELFENTVNRKIPPVDVVHPKDTVPVSPAIQSVLDSVAKRLGKTKVS